MNIRTNLTLVSAGLLAIASFAPPARANLLVDPGYESNPLNTAANVLGNFPGFQGDWGAEAGNIVPATGGVTPPQGVLMLAETDDLTGGYTQTFQATDVSAYSALINSGSAVVNMSALFDADASLPSALGGVGVAFYSGNNTGTAIGSPLTSLFTLDTNTSTWQSSSVSGAIPVGTTWLVSQVFYKDSSLLNSAGFNAAGYVDAADLTITPVPEPATFTLFATGGLGLAAFVWQRRRRRAVSSANGT